MKILFIADGRSPIAVGWISHFLKPGYDVHVISTYPCDPALFSPATVYQLPVAFSGLLRGETGAQNGERGQPARWKRRLAGLRKGRLAGLSLATRIWFGPLALQRHVGRARELAERIKPDLVHAMRIPFEGMLATQAISKSLPLVLSIWGNDLTLIANRYPLIGHQTRRILQRADMLHCDCERDLNLATRSWGFPGSRRAVVLPSSGGIDPLVFYRGEPDGELMRQLDIDGDAPVIINARGFRGYVRNDVFFRAIPLVLRHCPAAVFLCVAMQGNGLAEKWVKQLGIETNVRLLPQVARDDMAKFFRLAQVTVSPSLHDGTPNTLLEAMASGCFPVAGDIESVREWIDDGVNGLLCDATSADSLGGSIIRALDDLALRLAACDRNTQLIRERAQYDSVMQRAEAAYLNLLKDRQGDTTNR